MRLRNQNEFILRVLEPKEGKSRSDCVVGVGKGDNSLDVLVAKASSCVAMRARRTTEISFESVRRDL